MTIRHHLDTLHITDAPDFAMLDDATIACALREFSATSKEEHSGIVKKNATKSCSLDSIPASVLRYCMNDLLPVIQ